MKLNKSNPEIVDELRTKHKEKIDSYIIANDEQIPTTMNPDIKKVPHELEVYQIELEMQNNELKKAHQEIERSKQKYFDLYNLAPIGYLILNEKGIILNLNHTAAELFNDDKDSLINKHFYNNIVSSDRDIFYLHLVKLWETKSKQTFEIKLLKKDGTKFYGQLVCMPVIDEKKERKSCRVAVIDITERKRAEEQLLINQNFSHNIINSMLESLVVMNWDGIIQSVNNATCSLLNYTEKELIGKPIDFLFVKEKELFKAININELIKMSYIHDVETKYRAKDGGSIPILFSCSYIRTVEKKTLGIICVAQDITERIKVEEELVINRERLKTATSILRHDVINDLSVIKSAVDIYRDERDETMFDEIEKRVKKCMDTIYNQRDQAKFLDAHADLEEYDLEEVLHKVIEDYPDVRITVTGHGKVYADIAIYSVFENIINNAIKHGKTTQIDIDIIPNNKYCEIRIKDYGTGIPNEIKDKIFDEGFRYGETGHTGIGLYVVKRTIEEYGGEVFVEDNVPKGVVFIIRMNKTLT